MGRNWGFRVIAALFLGLIAAFHLLLQGDGSYTPWAAVSLPSAIPYANAYWMGYLLSLLIVFTGGEFLYKQGEKPQEGVSVRPFSNAAFVAGKMWGVFGVVFQLNLAAMAIAAAVNLTLSDGPFSLWPYLFYLVTLTLPTVVFVTGLTFLVKGACRNRAVAVLVLLLLFYAMVTYGKEVLHGALDVYASGVPNIFSDVTGFSGLGAYLAQRGYVLLLGAGLCVLDVTLVRRLPNRGGQGWRLYAPAAVLLVVGVLAACAYHGHFERKDEERVAARESFRQYNDAAKAHVAEHHIVFRQEGNSYKAHSRLTLENGSGEALDSVVLYLNPGLRITEAQAEGTPVGVRRRNQVAVLDLPLRAGERREVELRYEGGISPSVMYAEVEDLREKEAEMQFFIFRPGCELFCLTEDYTLLTPECLWYPTAQPPVDVDMPYFTTEDFTRFALDVVGTGGRTAISQGWQSANGDTTRFRNAKDLSGISLCVGDYVRHAIKTDTLDMRGIHPNMPDFQLEDTILCEVYVLKGHEHLLEKLRDARPYILKLNLRFMGDPRAYANYIFDKLAVVETPIHYVSYYRAWKTSTDYVQPEIVLRPEREAFSNALTCRKNLLHDIRGGAVEVAEDELRVENYLQAFTYERPLYRWDLTAFNNEFMDNARIPNESRLDLLSRYQFYHLGSTEFPGIHNIFTYMMKNWSEAVGTGASNQWVTTPEGIKYYSGGRNLFDLFQDGTQPPALKTGMVRSQAIALLREITVSIPKRDFDTFTQAYINRHNFTNIRYEDYCEEVRRRFGADLLALTRKYYERSELPRYMIRNARFVAEGKKGERTGYSFSADIRNAGGSDGTISIIPPSSSDMRSFVIPANSQRRVNLYISGNPEDIEYDLEDGDMEVQTDLSGNFPGDYNYELMENDGGKVDRRTGVFETDSVWFLPAEGEYVVDNADAGFHIDNKRSKVQKFLQKRAGKQESSSSGWRLGHNVLAFGEYTPSYYSCSNREDGQAIPRITWEADLPESGRYEVMAYVDKACDLELFTIRNRETGWAHVPLTGVTQTYLVDCVDGAVEVEIPLEEEGGWLSLGEFSIDAGKTRVVLTGKLGNPKQGLFADAVKWVKLSD